MGSLWELGDQVGVLETEGLLLSEQTRGLLGLLEQLGSLGLKEQG